MLWFTHLSGENFQLPGTYNYFELFIRVSTFTFEMHHHFVFLWTQFKLIKFYIWIIESVICFIWFHSYRVDLNCDIWHGFGVNNIQAGHWGFIEYRPPKKKTRISTKYRPHSTLSTKYRPQKFLEKRAFTIFTFKSWDIHILGKWGLSWNMRDKWGLFQLRTFRKALYMDHTELYRPNIDRKSSLKSDWDKSK